MSNSRTIFDADEIDFQNSVFEAVSLEVAGDCGIVAKRKHVWIDHLSKSVPEHDAFADSNSDQSQKRIEENGSVQSLKSSPCIKAPCNKEKIPATAPTAPERMLARTNAPKQCPLQDDDRSDHDESGSKNREWRDDKRCDCCWEMFGGFIDCTPPTPANSNWKNWQSESQEFPEETICVSNKIWIVGQCAIRTHDISPWKLHRRMAKPSGFLMCDRCICDGADSNEIIWRIGKACGDDSVVSNKSVVAD